MIHIPQPLPIATPITTHTHIQTQQPIHQRIYQHDINPQPLTAMPSQVQILNPMFQMTSQRGINPQASTAMPSQLQAIHPMSQMTSQRATNQQMSTAPPQQRSFSRRPRRYIAKRSLSSTNSKTNITY